MGKPDTKSKPRPKRDPNQPFPKKRKSLLLKIIVAGLVLGAVGIGGLHSFNTGRMPWEWGQADLEQMSSDVKDAVTSVDWEAIKGTITDQTRKLYESAPDLEKKLEATLARLRGSPQQPAGGEKPAAAETAQAPATGAKPDEKTPAAAVPSAAPPRAPTPLEEGCEAFQEAMQRYKRTVRSGKGDKRSGKDIQGEVRTARGLFEKAQGKLEKARADADKRKDEKEGAEIDELMQQCNTYLVDCRKRETL